MVMDILAPDQGEIRILGRRRGDGPAAAIGYLPEERGLYRKMTVLDHLVFQGELNGLARGEARRRALVWLTRMELPTWAKAKVETLSKGMQQKVQIAGTLLHDPELVILDEPFSGLDPINQILLKEILSEIQREGRTLIFSTHIMEHAEKLCDRVCLISKGRVILQGELAALKRERGGRAYRVAAVGDLERVAEVPGVESLVAGNGLARLTLEPGAQPGAVLRALAERVEVTEFRSEEPDLETLFIQAVRHAS